MDNATAFRQLLAALRLESDPALVPDELVSGIIDAYREEGETDNDAAGTILAAARSLLLDRYRDRLISAAEDTHRATYNTAMDTAVANIDTAISTVDIGQ